MECCTVEQEGPTELLLLDSFGRIFQPNSFRASLMVVLCVLNHPAQRACA